MKRFFTIVLRIGLFLILFSGIFYLSDQTLQFKYDDGITPMEDFYAYPSNSIDVLLLGSSHIGVNIDTTILYNDYGIASYKLWGATQPIWNSYYNLAEALKTQHPKVVVLEALGLAHTTEYYDYANAVKNTMGLHWSRNKVDAILASYEPDQLLNAFFPLSQYHSRYGELDDSDFSHYFWNSSISGHNTQNWDASCVMDPPSDTTERLPLGDKQLKYLKKIIYLCNKNDIPLLVLTAPYTTPDEERARLNTANDYLTENCIAQLDCLTNYEEYGIDFTSDFGDTAGHLNSTGCAKFSSILGEYLQKNYDLPVRSGEALFSSNQPSDAAYVLTETFTGDGQTDFIDTNQTLYSGNKNWTIYTRFSTHCDTDEKVVFSCFSETEPYHGLLVRLTDENQLAIVVGDNYPLKVDLPTLPKKDEVTLAIVKNGSQYTIYLEGEKVAFAESSCDTYNGTLLLGAERMANNTLGRLSGVTIGKFELYYTAKSDAEAKKWTKENRYIPPRDEQLEALAAEYNGIMTYTLPKRFTGDGESCIDTGMQLYADPDASWTLTADINIDEQDGTYLSCFNEEADAYSGLLVRKSQDTLSVQIGGGIYLSTLVYPGQQNLLKIQKSGSTYTVTLGSELLGTAEYTCTPYYGTLLIGAERGYDLEPFRYSTLTVNELTVRN